MTNIPELHLGERVGTYDGRGWIVKIEEDSFYGHNSVGVMQLRHGGDWVSTAHDPYRYDVLHDKGHRNSFDRSRLDAIERTVWAKNGTPPPVLKVFTNYYDPDVEVEADRAWTDKEVAIHFMAPDEDDEETAVDLAVRWIMDDDVAYEPSVDPKCLGDTCWYSGLGSDEWGSFERSVHLEGFTPEQEQAIYDRHRKEATPWRR